MVSCAQGGERRSVGGARACALALPTCERKRRAASGTAASWLGGSRTGTHLQRLHATVADAIEEEQRVGALARDRPQRRPHHLVRRVRAVDRREADALAAQR
eukprot:5507890-Prymnesium_polylepis.1